MFPLFNSKQKKESRRNKMFDTIKDISILSNKAGHAQKELDDAESNLLLENKDKYFISLADFITLMDDPNISIANVLSKCKHVETLTQSKSVSSISMYAIAEDDHIVLCKDTNRCTKHNKYDGKKIQIVTVRQVR